MTSDPRIVPFGWSEFDQDLVMLDLQHCGDELTFGEPQVVLLTQKPDQDFYLQIG